MKKFLLTFCKVIIFFLTYGFFFSIGRAQVVIIPDGSMGTQVIKNGNIHNITGGKRPGGGSNLIHSFGEFGVPTDNIANFLNDSALPTTNILSRVTGGNPSNILGLIQTKGFGNANLFLMNPAGIVFGPNAALNVGGATHFTTADYLQLTDGVQFTALPNAQDAVLSMAPVTEFGFLQSNPASILVDGSTLSVGEGEALSLVGGDLEISGGNLQGPDGQINLVSLSSPGTVLLGAGADMQINATQLGRIGLSDNASVNVDGESGGIIVIRGGNLLGDGSQISANATGSSEAGITGVSGYSIDIEVSKDVVLDNRSKVAADVSGLRDGKSIRVMADSNLEIRNSVLRTATFADGNAGNIEVQADKILFEMDRFGPGFDIFGISSLTLGSGNSGSIQLKAGNLQMLGGQLTTVTLQAAGKAGNVELTVENDISVIGGPGGGFIGANALFGSGNAGDILVAANNFTMSGPAFMQAVTAMGEGNAGNITINLQGNFDLSETASIDNFTDRGGAAGNISVTAKDIFLTGVQNPIFPTGQTSIGASSTDGGPGGNINLRAEDSLVIDRGILITRTTGSGEGGNINASAENLTFINGTSVTAESSSVNSDAGNAGNIQLTATDTILLDGAAVTTEAAQASGGNIKLTAQDLIRLNNSTISSSVEGDATTAGGNINIDPDHIVLQNSQILAKAVQGRGGNISLIANNAILVDPLSVLDASSALGVSGTVDIQAPIQNISGTLAPLPEDTAPVTALYGARCAAGSGGHFSTFVDSKAGSLAPTPGAFLASPLLLSPTQVDGLAHAHVAQNRPVILTSSVAPLVLGHAGEPTTACP